MTEQEANHAALDVALCRDLEQVDTARWDALLGPRGFYSASPWLRHAQATAAAAPYYFTAAQGPELIAALPAYPLEAGTPYIFCSPGRVVGTIHQQVTGEPATWPGALMPALACGGRNPSHTRAAVSGEVPAELAAKCHKAALEGRWSSIMRFFAGPRLLVIDELGYLPLPGDGASALFQVINQRYLKSSTILTTNVGIAKAHMFRRTRARCCRNFMGSTGGRHRHGHGVGNQRDQLLRPAVRLLGGDLGSTRRTDKVGAIQAIETAASVAAPVVRVPDHSRDVVGIEDEHAGVRADRVRPARHEGWQEPVAWGLLCDWRRHRYFPKVGADSLLTGNAGEDRHGRNSA